MHAPDVIARLPIRRHPAVFRHGPGSGVVGGKRQLPRAEPAVLLCEVARTAFHVLEGIPGIYPKVSRRRGHELGETALGFQRDS